MIVSKLSRAAILHAAESDRLQRLVQGHGMRVGAARFVVDLEGASGEWRDLLEQNGCVLLEPTRALGGPVHGAVVARHILSRTREPDRVLEHWLALLEPGGRVVLSGLLPSHANAALAAYRAQGLILEKRIPLDGWMTLILRR